MSPFRGSRRRYLTSRESSFCHSSLSGSPLTGIVVAARRVDDDGVLEEPPVAVARAGDARGAAGLGKGRGELGAAQGGGLPGAALADDEVPGKDIEGVALFFQVGLAQRAHGLLPALLQLPQIVALLDAQRLHARLVLVEHLLDEPLLAALGPDLPEDDPPDGEARDEQQQKEGHPPGPLHQQHEAEGEQHDENGDGGNQENLQQFKDALFHQFDTALRKFSPTWLRMNV